MKMEYENIIKKYCLSPSYIIFALTDTNGFENVNTPFFHRTRFLSLNYRSSNSASSDIKHTPTYNIIDIHFDEIRNIIKERKLNFSQFWTLYREQFGIELSLSAFIVTIKHYCKDNKLENWYTNVKSRNPKGGREKDKTKKAREKISARKSIILSLLRYESIRAIYHRENWEVTEVVFYRLISEMLKANNQQSKTLSRTAIRLRSLWSEIESYRKCDDELSWRQIYKILKTGNKLNFKISENRFEEIMRIIERESLL